MTLFSAASVRKRGVQPIIDEVAPNCRCIVTVDCDGLDPCVIPAVLVPQPGGLDYLDIVELLHGVGQRARIVGFDLVELVPDADLGGLGVLAASRHRLRRARMHRGPEVRGESAASYRRDAAVSSAL